MPELPALSAPTEAAEALDNAAVGPSAYSQADLSRRLKAGAAALRELARLRTFEAEVRVALEPFRAPLTQDPQWPQAVTALAALARTTLDAMDALDAARGGED